MTQVPFQSPKEQANVNRNQTNENQLSRIPSSLLYNKELSKFNFVQKKENAQKIGTSKRKSKKSKKYNASLTKEIDEADSKLPIIFKNNNKHPKQLNHSREQLSSLLPARHTRKMTQVYKQECVNRDKDKHPLKYKILAEFKGIDDSKVYELKEGEIYQLQNEYLKNKGLENLREGCRLGISKSASMKSPNFNSYIHKIFNHGTAVHRVNRSTKSLHHRTESELKQCQDMMGKIVFQRVREHLKQEREKPNFFHRVQAVSAIDNAIVSHLKLKISRAQSIMKK